MREFSNNLYEHLIMLHYREPRKTGVLKKMRLSELRLLMARELDAAWKKLCQTKMMESAFANVGLSLNIDGSEDHMMKFQGQKPGLPDSMKI